MPGDEALGPSGIGLGIHPQPPLLTSPGWALQLTFTNILKKSDLLIYFMYMNALPEDMSVHHVGTWCPSGQNGVRYLEL